jgi:hypothetical protein
MPAATPSAPSRSRPDAAAGSRAPPARFGPHAVTLHGLARDRLCYALILREARQKPVAAGAPWAMRPTVGAAALEAGVTRVEPPPGMAPAPLVIEPVLPSGSPVPSPILPPPAPARAEPARVEREPQIGLAWAWSAVIVGVLIISATAWGVSLEWRWLSLPLDRRISVARTIVDRWDGPGAYSRIDGENNRLFGRYLS